MTPLLERAERAYAALRDLADPLPEGGKAVEIFIREIPPTETTGFMAGVGLRYSRHGHEFATACVLVFYNGEAQPYAAGIAVHLLEREVEILTTPTDWATLAGLFPPAPMPGVMGHVLGPRVLAAELGRSPIVQEAVAAAERREAFVVRARGAGLSEREVEDALDDLERGKTRSVGFGDDVVELFARLGRLEGATFAPPRPQIVELPPMPMHLAGNRKERRRQAAINRRSR